MARGLLGKGGVHVRAGLVQQLQQERRGFGDGQIGDGTVVLGIAHIAASNKLPVVRGGKLLVEAVNRAIQPASQDVARQSGELLPAANLYGQAAQEFAVEHRRAPVGPAAVMEPFPGHSQAVPSRYGTQRGEGDIYVLDEMSHVMARRPDGVEFGNDIPEAVAVLVDAEHGLVSITALGGTLDGQLSDGRIFQF